MKGNKMLALLQELQGKVGPNFTVTGDNNYLYALHYSGDEVQVFTHDLERVR